VRRIMFTLSLVVGLVVGAVLPAAAGPRRSYEIDEDRRAALLAAIEEEGVATYDGELAGALWVAQVPDDWNGDLVAWAHGYRGEGPALYVDPPPAREWLLEEGYAWVASSYRRNSYDPGIGVIDTMKATKHVQNLLGGAERTYLFGASMGGHVTAAAIETYPGLYDGAVPACGVLGDVELFDYFLDYNLGAAAFAGLEPGSFAYPTDDWTSTTVPTIKSSLALGGTLSGGFFGPQLLTPAGEAFKDFVEVGSGGDRGIIYDAAWDYWHLLADPTGNFFFDLGEGDGTIADRAGIVSQNSDTEYAVEYGVDIDDEVVRIDAANRVRNAQGTKPAPIVNGTPDVPVLTIHTIGDLFVPIEMEQLYAAEVAANGRSDLLVQRAIRDVGHCTFTTQEWIDSFDDLITWVETGVKPAGDDISDLSSPLAGCQFTRTDPAPPGSVRIFSCP
jgi:pimeloyl-ACP methyl ester carboxylesterase